MRILIVEDEPRLARTVADLLREHRYAADIAPDGPSGLDNALTGIFDAVILDVMLPGLDGFEVVRRLRQQGCARRCSCSARTEVGGPGLRPGQRGGLLSDQALFQRGAARCLRALTRRQGEQTENVLAFGDLRLELASCLLVCGAPRCA